MIHITRSNVIVMSGLPADLPLYAAPLAGSSRTAWHATPARATSLVDTWVPYGRIVERDHPWFDRGERAVNQLRLTSQRYQARVTATNAPICLRVALPADALGAALVGVAEQGAIEVGACRLSLDPSSRHDGDATAFAIIDGTLTMPWMWGALQVRAFARPWSSTRADLVFVPTRRRLRYPRRWFTVGFSMADELRRRVVTQPCHSAL